MLKKIVPIDGASSDQFGAALSLSGEILAVGARLDDDIESNTGSAYVYGRNYNPANPAIPNPTPNSWALVEKFLPPPGKTGAHFGYSIGVSGHVLIVGSNFDANSPVDSTYLFRLKYNNTPLLTTPILDVTIVAGQPFNFTVLPFFADLDLGLDLGERLLLTATLANGSVLPAWVGFNAGLFSGTDPQAGMLSILVTATDRDVASVSDSFDATVAPAAAALLRIRVVQPPAIGLASFRSDYDGRAGLADYAFPSGRSAGGLSTPASLLSVARDPSTGQLFVGFVRRSNDPRLTYRLERSTDFKVWTSAASTLQEVRATAVNAEFEAAIYFYADDNDAEQPVQFFRVQAVFGR
jgi:hypothetical protein